MGSIEVLEASLGALLLLGISITLMAVTLKKLCLSVQVFNYSLHE